jgi:hypothetical protein
MYASGDPFLAFAISSDLEMELYVCTPKPSFPSKCDHVALLLRVLFCVETLNPLGEIPLGITASP